MIPAKVKNWSKFQHYRHRAPTWIKLHRALLDDFAFVRLPTVAKAVLPQVWMLAAEGDGDGSFDADPEYLAFRLRMPIEEVAAALEPLVNQGFIAVTTHHASELLARCARIIADAVKPDPASLNATPTGPRSLPAREPLENQEVTAGAKDDASNALATCYQLARPERETEAETEVKQEQTRLVGNTTGREPRAAEEPGDAKAADPPPDPGATVAYQLPAKGGELVDFTRADVLELAERYPLVDVDGELRSIRGWLIENTERRKVGRKGTRKMVNTWLGKEQRRQSDAQRHGKAPNAVGATFDSDQHQAQGAGFWLDPQSSTETREHDPD